MVTAPGHWRIFPDRRSLYGPRSVPATGGSLGPTTPGRDTAPRRSVRAVGQRICASARSGSCASSYRSKKRKRSARRRYPVSGLPARFLDVRCLPHHALGAFAAKQLDGIVVIDVAELSLVD